MPESCETDLDESLIDESGTLELLVAQLHLDVREPGLFFGLPFHPALKHLGREGGREGGRERERKGGNGGGKEREREGGNGGGRKPGKKKENPRHFDHTWIYIPHGSHPISTHHTFSPSNSDPAHPHPPQGRDPPPDHTHLACAGNVPQHLLHVRVLVPELVGAGQNGDGAVPYVARMVDLLVLHLHLGVLEPDYDAAVVDVECSLVDRACALELTLRCLPYGVLDPVGHYGAVLANVVLEFFPLLHLEVGELARIRDLLAWGRGHALHLGGRRLVKELLSRYLDLGRHLVLDLCDLWHSGLLCWRGAVHLGREAARDGETARG